LLCPSAPAKSQAVQALPPPLYVLLCSHLVSECSLALVLSLFVSPSPLSLLMHLSSRITDVELAGVASLTDSSTRRARQTFVSNLVCWYVFDALALTALLVRFRCTCTHRLFIAVSRSCYFLGESAKSRLQEAVMEVQDTHTTHAYRYTYIHISKCTYIYTRGHT
jgi:hypothetical protein